jgi:hypothetical protein
MKRGTDPSAPKEWALPYQRTRLLFQGFTGLAFTYPPRIMLALEMNTTAR